MVQAVVREVSPGGRSETTEGRICEKDFKPDVNNLPRVIRQPRCEWEYDIYDISV